MRALIEKELRENIRWLPVGLVLISVLTWFAIPNQYTLFSHLSSDLVGLVGLGAAIFAFGLGVMQSAFDLRNGARAYLFHRSVSILQIVAAKVISGFAIYAIAVTVPLALMAIWLSRQGLETRPVRPAQVVPAFVVSMFCFLFHPTAMILLARPANWIGTKLWPITPTIMICCYSGVFLAFVGLAPSMLLAVMPLLIIGLFLSITVYSWNHLATETASRKFLLSSYLSAIYLFLGAVGIHVAIVILASVFSQSLFSRTSNGGPTYVVDSSNSKPWYVTGSRFTITDSMQSRIVAPEKGSLIKPGEVVSQTGDLPIDFKPAYFNQVHFPREYMGDGFFERFDSLHTSLIYDSRGYILQYFENKLHSVIAANGSLRGTTLHGVPWLSNPIAVQTLSAPGDSPGWNRVPLFSKNQLHLFNQHTNDVESFFSGQVDWVLNDYDELIESRRFLFASGSRLHEYRWNAPKLKDETLERGILAANAARSAIPYLEKVREVPLPPVLTAVNSKRLWGELAFVEDGYVFFDRLNNRFASLQFSGELTSEIITFKPFPIPLTPSHLAEATPLGIVPPSYFIVPYCVMAIIGTVSPAKSLDELSEDFATVLIVVGLIVVVTLISAIATWFLCRRRALGLGLTIIWTCVSILIGMVAPLAVVAIYRRVYFEPCPKCDRARRIDQRLCPHCNAAWEPPATDGIEILSRSNSLSNSRLQSALAE